MDNRRHAKGEISRGRNPGKKREYPLPMIAGVSAENATALKTIRRGSVRPAVLKGEGDGRTI